MKSVVPGANIKVLARAIHSLAKIGEDLYVNAEKEGLSLRTMNSSRSAFVSYTFHPQFFSSYSHTSVANISRTENDTSTPPTRQRITDAHLSNAENKENSKCKVKMRGIMIAFKSITQLEKTAESCVITVCNQTCKLKVRLICKYMVTKTYALPLIESDSIMARYDESSLRNQFIAQAKILTEAVLNFLTNQEEVTMLVNRDHFSMKNFIEDVNGRTKIVHTQLTMQPTEFEDFSISKESNVTYCLKELRAIISFADSMSLPLKASFNDGGEPIIFTLNSPDLFDATLVMATLAEQRNNEPPNSAESTHTLNGSKADGHISTQESFAESNRHPPISTSKNPIKTSSKIEEREVGSNGDDSTSNTRTKPFVLSSRVAFNDNDLFVAARNPNSSNENNMLPVAHYDAADTDNQRKDVSEMVHNTPSQSHRLKIKTPPSATAKYIFKRTFDATFNPSSVRGTDIILASDSGEESS